MTPEMLFSYLVTGIGGALATYAALKNGRVLALTTERDEWKAANQASRDELHAAQGELQSALLQLAELRERTNFAPIERKLEGFMERQDQVNASLCKSLETLTQLMGRIVPAMTAEQQKEQEKPLHEE